MRRVQRPPVNRAVRAQTATFPSPIRGLNARDPLAGMKPTDALVLDNLLCRTSDLEVRKGRQTVATGFAASVRTLMPYTAVSGTQQIFAAAGTGIFNATASGAIGAAVVTGLTESYWQSTQVANAAGNFLICCNGTDNAKIYDGTVWGNSAVTGLALTSIVQVAAWKRRLWYVEKNSLRVWYSAADAIAGALTSFTFSGIFRRGGKLLAIIPWTRDSGAGSDDLFVAVTSMGEVAIYQGTDPSAAATFALVGVYSLGTPVGTRFYTQYGGDVLLLTSEGLIPLTKYIQSETIDRTVALTDRIQQSLSTDISSYGTTQGWEVHVHFDATFLFINVPAGTGTAYQYAMNLITGAWSRFLIGGALTWAVQGNTLFMGDATQTYNAWTGGVDVAEAISYWMIPAFSYFRAPTQQKVFGLSRVLFEADTPPLFRWAFLGDFDLTYSFVPLFAAANSGNLWDVALWDQGSWDALTTYSKLWHALAGVSYAGTQVIYGVSAGSTTRIISIDYTYEVGALL